MKKEITFDLFKLHDSKKDIRPFSWICFDKNDKVTEILHDLLKQIRKNKGMSIKKLSKMISNKLKCHSSTIEKYFYTKKWIAIPVILELLNYVSSDEKGKIINKFNENVKFLKSSGPTSESIKAVKFLTLNLCKFAGIHAADGTLVRKLVIYSSKSNLSKIIIMVRKFLDKSLVIRYDKWVKSYCIILCAYNDDFHKVMDITKNFDVKTKISYFFRVVENYKKPIQILSDLINIEFCLNKKPIKFKGVNAWSFTCANKILVRYLNTFFGFPFGSKSHHVDIPNIIKDASYEHQRLFWSGFLQFDGSVEWDKRIVIQVSSKNIVESLGYFLMNNGLLVNYIDKPDKRGCYTLRFYDKFNKLNLFFDGTLKYQKLNRNFSKRVKNSNEALRILRKITYSPTTKITADKLLLIMKDIRTIESITDFHKKILLDIDIERTALSRQLNILEMCNIIKCKMNWRCKEYAFNDNIEEWRFPDVEVD